MVQNLGFSCELDGVSDVENLYDHSDMVTLDAIGPDDNFKNSFHQKPTCLIRKSTHVIRWKSLTLNNDLMTTIDIRSVKCRQQKMKIGRKSFHDSNLGRKSTNYGSNAFRSSCVSIKPCWQRRLGERFEVAKDTLCRPSCEILLHAC